MSFNFNSICSFVDSLFVSLIKLEKCERFVLRIMSSILITFDKIFFFFLISREFEMCEKYSQNSDGLKRVERFEETENLFQLGVNLNVNQFHQYLHIW